MNILQKLKNRKLAKQEHESIEFLYDLGFNRELEQRINYKRDLLRNEIFETSGLNPNDSVDLVRVENYINKKLAEGKLDIFYNKI